MKPHVHALLDGDDAEVHVGTRAATLEDKQLWRGYGAVRVEVEVDRRSSEILYIPRAITLTAAMRAQIARSWQISRDGNAVAHCPKAGSFFSLIPSRLLAHHREISRSGILVRPSVFVDVHGFSMHRLSLLLRLPGERHTWCNIPILNHGSETET